MSTGPESAITSSQSTTSATEVSSPSSTTTSDDKKDSNNGLKIGLGVAIPIVCLLILGLAFWFWKKKRNAGSRASIQAGGEQSAYQASARKYELAEINHPVELDAGYGK